MVARTTATYPSQQQQRQQSKIDYDHSRNMNQNHKHGQNQMIHSMTEGASNLWKIASITAKATVQHLAQVTPFFGPSITPLTDSAESNLAQLSEYLDTSFDDTNAEHIQILKNLWNIQWNIPGNEQNIPSYQRKDEKWKHAGWQTDDPISDLKSSGILAIHSLIYFGNKFPSISSDRIIKNQANVKTNYPYAIVAVNLTLLLADLLALKDNR